MTAVKVVRYHITGFVQGVHLKRLEALFVVVEALLTGANLCLTRLGRAVAGPVADKHSIKRVDRLLGNGKLHMELHLFYGAIARLLLKENQEPVVLVDWTEMGSDWQVLTAAVPATGRSVPIYSEVHPSGSDHKASIQRRFLASLKEHVIPSGCQPIIVTDSGFQNPWFRTVRALGWDFVGRLASTPYARVIPEVAGGSDTCSWLPVTELMAKAGPRPADLGSWTVTKSNQLDCRLILYKVSKKGRKGSKKPNRKGVHAGSQAYQKAAKRARTPWLLATSLTSASAHQVVNVYTTRMQIEETFRDSKSHRFGWSLEDVRSQDALRLAVLLLIAALGMVVVHSAGVAAENQALIQHMQANTTRHRRVLSIFFVGSIAVRNSRWRRFLTQRVLTLALMNLRERIRANAPTGGGANAI